MKRYIVTFFLFMLSLISLNSNAQKISEDQISQFQQQFDSLSPEQKKMVFDVVEIYLFNGIDSLINEGMYMQALENIDSTQVKYETVFGRKLPPYLYVIKANILSNFEDWEKMLSTTVECIKYHKDSMSDREAAMVYKLQGEAFYNMKVYLSAIQSYESSMSKFNVLGEKDSQGDILIRMATCYEEIGKSTLALTLYEKGVDRFLDYLGTTRANLIQKNFFVTDSRKKIVRDLLAVNLYHIAVFYQEIGDKTTSKEYLIMSKNCGCRLANSEYERIYGRW